MRGHGFSEAVARKPFLDPDPGSRFLVGPLPESREFFLGPDSGNRNYLLLFSCPYNKRTCGDMQDR